MLNRMSTISNLLKAKTIGFFGGLCLLFNAMTGPGIPYTPLLFSVDGSGAFMSFLSFLFFAVMSGFSVLLIIEAMQSIPGNKHFQGTVEFGTLINFYFGKYPHIFGQLLLYGALQSNAIQSINTDNLLIDIFGKTCGLSVYEGWICVARKSLENPSPFQCTPMIFTLGFLVTIVLVIPMGIINLDDNIMVQMGKRWTQPHTEKASFSIALLIGIQWCISAFLMGIDTERVPWFSPNAAGYGTTIGTVMLNLAFTTVVPSWVNIKRKDVNAQAVVWTSVFSAVAYYVVLGVCLSLAIDPNSSGSVLPDLMGAGIPLILTRITVYAYAFVMLVTSIPVSFIVSYNNLVQNQVTGKWVSIFVSFVLPWLFAIPLQTGSAMPSFITWTSLLFVSTANFIVPVLIYFSCQKFRRAYNENRELTDHQIALLKLIHWSSRTIHKFIDERGNTIPDLQPDSPKADAPDDSDQERGRSAVISVEPPKESDVTALDRRTDVSISLPSPILLSPFSETLKPRRPSSTRSGKSGSLQFELDVRHSRSRSPRSRLSAVSDEDGKIIPSWLQEDVPDPEAEDLLRRPISIGRRLSTFLPSLSSETSHLRSNLESGTQSLSAQNSEAQLLPNTGLGIIEADLALTEPSGSNLHRVQTLPTHPHFTSPAFRSVPSWIPVRASQIATALLCVTAVLSVANIIFSTYMFATEPAAVCISD